MVSLNRTALTDRDPQSSSAPSAAARLSEARRETARHSLLAFAETYLPLLFSLPPSPMHTEIARDLETLSARSGGSGAGGGGGGRGGKLAVAAPRGYAKSSLVVTAYALWSLAFEREPYIVIVSDTADQAIDHLRSIKQELEDNERLREDFPGLCETPAPGTRPGPERWRKDDIITRSVPAKRGSPSAGGMRVSALGAEQKLRGRRNRDNRPSLIMLDDIENEEIARSAEQRDKRLAWIRGTVLQAGTPRTNCVAVGTVLSPGSVLAHLLDPAKSPGWTTRKYRAVESYADRHDLWDRWRAVLMLEEEFEGASGLAASRAYFSANRAAMLEGAKVLWPEKETYLDLMEQRVTGGRASFESEKQNEPISAESCFFRESDLLYWDDPRRGNTPTVDALLATLRSRCAITGACDPAMGRPGVRGDYSAIVIIAREYSTGVKYVLAADVSRCRPDELLDRIMKYHELFRLQSFGVEENGFQQLLSDALARRSSRAMRPFSVRGIKNTGDKAARVQALQPLLTTGQLRLSRRQETLISQLLQFPHGPHDDGPDALAMAVEVANRSVGRVVSYYGDGLV